MNVISTIGCSSRIGRFHKENGLKNQDAVTVFEDENIAVAVLADGVSQCRFGGEGAVTACKAVEVFLKKNGSKLWSLTARKTVAHVLNTVKNAVAKLGGEPEEYASTLCFAMLEKHSGRLMLFCLGDSNIYLFSDSGCELFCAQDKAEVRFTVSPDAERSARLEILPSNTVSAVLLCSDGAWRSMYEGNRMTEQLSAAAKKGDIGRFIEYFDSRDNIDDSSYAFLAFEEGDNGN